MVKGSLGQILHPRRTRSEQGWKKISSNPSCCTWAPEPCWDHQGKERGSTLSPPVASATEPAQDLPKGFEVPRVPRRTQLQGDCVSQEQWLVFSLLLRNVVPSQELRFHCARHSSEIGHHLISRQPRLSPASSYHERHGVRETPAPRLKYST